MKSWTNIACLWRQFSEKHIKIIYRIFHPRNDINWIRCFVTTNIPTKGIHSKRRILLMSFWVVKDPMFCTEHMMNDGLFFLKIFTGIQSLKLQRTH